MSSTILDYAHRVAATEGKSFNELRTLETLQVGLHELAVSVWRAEAPIRQRTEGQGFVFYGNLSSPNLPPDAKSLFAHLPPHMRMLLPCFFHWYGVTLINYARLVGFVDAIESGRISKDSLQNYDTKAFGCVKKACNDYVASVPEIQDVFKWRNKVAAHFAITDPRKDDNPMTLEASVVYPVSYDGGRFRVSSWVHGRAYPDGTKYESELPMWSLTEVHENISARYWPGFEFPSHPAD